MRALNDQNVDVETHKIQKDIVMALTQINNL